MSIDEPLEGPGRSGPLLEDTCFVAARDHFACLSEELEDGQFHVQQ